MTSPKIKLTLIRNHKVKKGTKILTNSKKKRKKATKKSHSSTKTKKKRTFS